MMSKLPKILLGIFAVALALLVAMQVYIVFSNPYVVETVYKAQVDESFALKGVVARDEIVLEQEKSGAVDYEIRNGDKVAKNSVIAQMYPSEQDIATMAQVERMEAELETVKASQQGSTAATQANALTRQINSINDEYVSLVLNHDLDSLYEVKNNFLDAYNRSQILFSTATDFNARIAELEAQIATLKQQSGSSASQVVASSSGYFVNMVDGYEGDLTLEKASGLTAEDIEAYFSQQEQEVQSNSVGKIITNAQWRYVALMDADDAMNLNEGWNYNLRFPSSGDDTVVMNLVSCKIDNEADQALVVFESDRISEQTAKLRLEEAEVILNTFEGIKIPKSALHIIQTDEGSEKGVYIKYGQTMQFKKVDILYENEEYFISRSIETENERSDYVRIYDDVIVKGSDFYDGKQIK